MARKRRRNPRGSALGTVLLLGGVGTGGYFLYQGAKGWGPLAKLMAAPGSSYNQAGQIVASQGPIPPPSYGPVGGLGY